MNENDTKTMLAISVWNGRVAPVFDVANHLLLIEINNDTVANTKKTDMPDSPALKSRKISEIGIKTLICGAISMPLEEAIKANGIMVFSFISGEVDIVVSAWLSGTLLEESFLMPGCCGRRFRNKFHGNFSDNREAKMQQGNRGGGGQMVGQGMNQAKGRGRMGGGFAAGPGGFCLCPVCKHREPHERGVPCIQKKCPKCNAPMVRG